MLDPQKLKEFREEMGLNQSAFATKIGYSREVVSKIENGKMEASKWFVEAVDKLRQSAFSDRQGGDVKILGKFSQGRAGRGKTYLEERQAQKHTHTPYLVPLVGIKAQAGYVHGYEQTDYLDTLEKYSLPPGVNPLGAVWRYFEIDGDSMEPTLSGGDVMLATMVTAEDWSDVKDFCIYIVHTADQLLVKRVYKKSSTEWVLISDNDEQYPQVLLPVEHIKQVWLMRRHIRSKAPMPKEFKIRC